MSLMKQNRKISGFTLAELLIALTILAEIVTFTIPKILVSSTNGKYNSGALEVASMVSAAYQIYKVRAGGDISNSGFGDMSPYLNYVSVDSTSIIDAHYTSTTYTCLANGHPTCLKLHNGGTLYYWAGDVFGGTATTNGIHFNYDPDGGTDGTTNGPGKSIKFVLYTTGRVVDYANVLPGTAYSNGTPVRTHTVTF